MADNEKYMIKIEGAPIEVTPEVYYTYFHMERQERWQEEKKQEHGVFSYDALDNGETVGAEAMPDLAGPGIEESAMAKEIYETLHRAVAALPRAERALIQAIYFDGLTEKEYAVSSGLSQQGVSYRLKKILSKLKTFMNFMGSF